MNGVLIPSQFGGLWIPLQVVQVKSGDKLRVTCQYVHRGQGETRKLYAAIGNSGWAGFDEILHGEKSIVVPQDTNWAYRQDYADISITTAISAGFYDLYAKINGITPAVISPTLHDVVEVTAAVSDSEFGEITITNYVKV